MTFEKKTYIRYRIDRAEESISEARLIAKMNHWNSVANRLYYACFYAVNALLLNYDIKAKTHSGVRNKFHELINSKLSNQKDLGRLYSELFDLRNRGDYLDLVILDQEMVEPLLDRTENFINQIINLIGHDES